jgi:hypothetical protein
MSRPSTSEIVGLLLAAVFVVVMVVGWARGAHAADVAQCGAATERGAMAEYDMLAGMVGIPPGASIRTLEKRQYVAAVCLHEELRK